MIDTTETIDQIYRHGSVRRYRTDPVSDALVEKIVSAGQRASTSSNLQAYSVVAVRDQRTRNRLQTLCGDQSHISQAPVFLAWCADLSRLARAGAAAGRSIIANYVENFLVAAVDAAIAMQTAALAAESLGLGICYIGAIRNDPAAVIRLLNLPPLAFPVSGMTLGWPQNLPIQRPRLPLPAVLHWERYGTAEEAAALAEYDLTMIASGIYQGRQIGAPQKGKDANPYGWVEHSTRRASQAVRTGLRSALQDQGFSLG